jgi:hypothetical protein
MLFSFAKESAAVILTFELNTNPSLPVVCDIDEGSGMMLKLLLGAAASMPCTDAHIIYVAISPFMSLFMDTVNRAVLIILLLIK